MKTGSSCGKWIFFLSLLVLVSCSTKPSKPAGICISFDDRFIHEWHSLLPLFKKYNARVTFFVTQFDSLSKEEVILLRDLKNHGNEIGSHGAIHVVSEHYIRKYSYQEYFSSEIDPSIRSMREEGFDPRSFAYPYGASYWFTDYMLLKKFDVVRTVSPLATRALEDLDEIYFNFSGRGTVSALSFDQGSGLTREMIADGLSRAAIEGEVILLYGHSPAKQNDFDPYHFDPMLLQFILEEAQKRSLKFYTVTELVNEK